MVRREAIAESGELVGVVTRVARQLSIGPESLRNWVKQAEVDAGKRTRLSLGVVAHNVADVALP